VKKELRWYQPARWVRWAIRLYQRTLSPLTGSNCRYLPTCSAFAVEAVEEHGAVKGLWMAGKRIARCNPWSTDGFEHHPVPPAKDSASA